MQHVFVNSALKPSDFERRRALSAAICEIMWQAGGRTRCCLCLQQDTAYFDTDYTYRVDGITEKVGPWLPFLAHLSTKCSW